MDERGDASPASQPMLREGSDLLTALRSPTSSNGCNAAELSQASFNMRSVLDEPGKSPPSIPGSAPQDLAAEYGIPPAVDDASSRGSSASPKQRTSSGVFHNQALLDELLGGGSNTTSGTQNGDTPPLAAAASGDSATTQNSPKFSDPANANSLEWSKGTGGAAQKSRGYIVGSMQVRSSSIADVIQRASDHETPKIMPTALPQELKLPMALRCDFCIKFDSVCSQCHFKWKGILESRRIVLFNHFNSVPEHRKAGVLFASIAHGSVPFVRTFFETWPASIYWRAEFHPLVDTRPVVPDDIFVEKPHRELVSIRDAGFVYPLHVAFHARRLDMVNLLLDLGSIVRKSDKGVSPMELIAMSSDWEDMLETRDAFVEFNMKERARRLRAEGQFADAALEYDALLGRNPRNENARCGVAKMAIETGRWKDAIALCKALLSKPQDVHWVEFDLKTVQTLLADAQKRLHDECHVQEGPALKECGFIVTARTVVSLRRRNGFIALFRDRILPFCDCKTLWCLWKSTKIPLLRKWTEQVATASSIDTIGGMLSEEYGYAEMYDVLRQDLPDVTGKNAVLRAPLRLLGLQVTAMADFNTYFLRSAVVGANPKFINDTGFFGFGSKKSEDRRMKLVATKDFRLHRAGEGKAFEVHDLAEWEIDTAATARIPGNIAPI